MQKQKQKQIEGCTLLMSNSVSNLQLLPRGIILSLWFIGL